MAWDTTKPTTGTKLRLVPSVITPNWDAIETGEVPYDKLQLQEQAGNPTNAANTAYLYSKEDAATGYTELFSINSNGNAIQLTKGAVAQLTPTAPTLSTTGKVYLPGGVLMQWGSAAGTWSGGTTITYSVAFSGTPYSVTANALFVGTTKREFVQVSSIGATTFTPRLIEDGGGNVSESRTLYWIAIGPT